MYGWVGTYDTYSDTALVGFLQVVNLIYNVSWKSWPGLMDGLGLFTWGQNGSKVKKGLVQPVNLLSYIIRTAERAVGRGVES